MFTAISIICEPILKILFCLKEYTLEVVPLSPSPNLIRGFHENRGKPSNFTGVCKDLVEVSQIKGSRRDVDDFDRLQKRGDSIFN